MIGPLAATAARLAEAVAALGTAAAALRPFGTWGGALLAVAGAAALTVGARSARVLGAWGGAAAGALAAFVLQRPIQAHLGLASSVAAWIGAAVGGAVCLAFPGAFPFAAGALPGALVGTELVRGPLGTGGGALVGGLIGIVASRLVSAAFASFAGGILLALGLSSALAAHPLAREVAARPFALAGVALVLGIAGTAYQAARVSPPAARAARSPESPP